VTEIVTIRPEPGDAATVAMGRELGLTISSHPLFAVEPVAWHAPDPARFDAVLIGSANALRMGGPELKQIATLPALCVGEATAQAARDAGFEVRLTGSGGMQTLLPKAEQLGLRRLLRLSGEAHVPLALPPGIAIETRVLYRVLSRAIPESLAGKLRHGALVLLHSGEAASHFAAEIDRLGIDRARIAVAALAPRIAERAGPGWAACASASTPDDRALLALTAQMCQSTHLNG